MAESNVMPSPAAFATLESVWMGLVSPVSCAQKVTSSRVNPGCLQLKRFLQGSSNCLAKVLLHS